jgi:putative transposase
MANELWLKLGLRVSPHTVRKYLPKRLDRGTGKRATSQGWLTFVRNHAQAIVACDFCVAVTATFRIFYVFVVIEHVSRQLRHVNVTAHIVFSSMTRTRFSHILWTRGFAIWGCGC